MLEAAGGRGARERRGHAFGSFGVLGGFHPGASARLTLPSTALLVPQTPLELGLRGPRPALLNLPSTPYSRLLSLAQTQRVC